MAAKKDQSPIHLFEQWPFGKKNYWLFGAGLVTIITGYIVMTTGEVNSFQSLTVAPIMLFVGYLVIVPLALVYRGKKRESPSSSDTQGS